MSDLECRNGKMYKKVPCYNPEGELDHFVLVEVPSGPSVPPQSLFSEVAPAKDNSAPATVDSTPIIDSIEEEDVDATVEEKTALEIEEIEEQVDIQEDCEIQSDIVEEVDLIDATKLTLEQMEAQKTIEDADVIDDDDSEDDGASSIGSSSVDHTDESSDLELVKEESVKEEFYLMFSALDEFDLDENLRTSDGKYLTNVDGRYVFEWNDIATLVGDGKAHRLHFKDTPNKVQRTKQAEVCFKPLYKTLKRVQVRSGPGSKFESTGIVGANQQVIVIQQGLMQCTVAQVQEWMQLHLPEDLVYDFGRRQKNRTFESFIERNFLTDDEDMDLIDIFITETYDEFDANVFNKALAAANRKVYVMYKEDGVEKYGWISKKKNSGALIARLYGKSTPQIVVSGVETQPNDSDFTHVEDYEGTLLPDVMEYTNTHTKSTVVKYGEWNGEEIKQKEKTEKHPCKPPMSFYKKLAKSEISSIVGSKASRFNIDWQSSFKSDRFRGLEKQSVLVQGKNGLKPRMRTGYSIPHTEFTVTFQKLSDAVNFFNADLEDTRFANVDLDWDQAYANLHPVDARACPEYREFERETKQRTSQTYISNIRDKMGIALITL